MHPWAPCLLQQQWVPDGGLKGGGTALVWSCSNLTGRLPAGKSAVGGQAFLVKPSSGLSCQQAGRAVAEDTGRQDPGVTHSRPCAHQPWESRGHSFPPALTSTRHEPGQWDAQ